MPSLTEDTRTTVSVVQERCETSRAWTVIRGITSAGSLMGQGRKMNVFERLCCRCYLSTKEEPDVTYAGGVEREGT